MGTTAQKLTYLNDTKQLLKDSINSLGGEITSQTTFRQYATELDSIYASLPKVSGTGTNISLSPTRKGRITSQINGDTFQQTYTGKNINSKGIRNGLYQISNGNYASSPGYATLEDLLPATYGDTITVSTQAGLTGNFYILEYDENKTYLNVNNNVKNVTSATFTISDTNTKYIAIDYINNTSGSATKYGGIQIETGSSVSPYEPYVGGTASPNPEFPQNIQSVTGTQNITVCRKNFAKLKNGTYTQANNTLVITNNNLLTINSNTSGSNTYISLGNGYNQQWSPTQAQYVNINDAKLTGNGGDYIATIYSNKTSNAQIQFTIITSKNRSVTVSNLQNNTQGTLSISLESDEHIKDIGMWMSGNNVFDDYQVRVQIERGTTSSTYEAYNGNDYTIHLGNMKLKKKGDYQDYISGTPNNWVKNNKIGNIIFNGTETWSNASSIASGTSRFLYLDDTVYNSRNNNDNTVYVSSNKFIGLSWKEIYSTDTTTKNAVANYNNDASASGRIVIRIDSTYANTVDAFKTWLSNNNVEVDYVLATPTTTPITDTTLINDLNNFYYAMSKNGETNISVDGSLPIILDVSALKGEE